MNSLPEPPNIRQVNKRPKTAAMEKKKTAPRRPAKSKPPVKKRSARDPESPLDVLCPSPWKNPHYQRLTDLAPKIGEAAMMLHSNTQEGKELRLPSEKLLHEVLDALGQFRRISRRSPDASLLTLAAEADEMWERLHLCERIKRLATNLKPWMLESPIETLEWSRKDPDYLKRLRSILRENADATASDLVKLIPLFSEASRRHIEVVAKTAQTVPAQIALARFCADFLRERESRYAEQRRLLQPLNNFFCQFDSAPLLCEAGFISEVKMQLIMRVLRYQRARANARARQERHRSRQKKPPAQA